MAHQTFLLVFKHSEETRAMRHYNETKVVTFPRSRTSPHEGLHIIVSLSALKVWPPPPQSLRFLGSVFLAVTAHLALSA